MDIQEKATQFIEEKCEEMKQESSRSCIGLSFDEDFIYNGKEYNIAGMAHWEKSDWYDVRITGNGIDIPLSDSF